MKENNQLQSVIISFGISYFGLSLLQCILIYLVESTFRFLQFKLTQHQNHNFTALKLSQYWLTLISLWVGYAFKSTIKAYLSETIRPELFGLQILKALNSSDPADRAKVKPSIMISL